MKTESFQAVVIFALHVSTTEYILYQLQTVLQA